MLKVIKLKIPPLRFHLKLIPVLHQYRTELRIPVYRPTLIYGRNQEEHDCRLTAVLQRLQQENVTLNKDKCKFSVNCVRFLGHIIDSSGICPDPQKVEAIQMMPTPKSPLEVCRFLGIANQLGKFLPSLAEMSKSLWDLFSKKTRSWGESQAKAFQAVKKALSSSPILVFTSQTVRPSFQ